MVRVATKFLTTLTNVMQQRPGSSLP